MTRNGILAKANACLLALVVFTVPSAAAEVVDVKYRGQVDLKPFACQDTVSSFVHRVCYDHANAYMLIKLQATWYHYCEIDGATVAALVAAPSAGRYYNASVKGKFDCRVKRMPTYQSL